MQAIRRLNLIILCLLTQFAANAGSLPDISLEGLDGGNHKISKYIGHGQWVVLNIWGTRCPPCRDEIPELVNFHDEYKSKDGIVLGIAIDFPSYGYAKKDEVIAFSDDYLIDFPNLLSDATVTEKLGLGRLEGLPTTFIFDPEGKVVGTQVGGITKKILEDFINKLKQKKSYANNH
jgi:thiol-disulfide isomerase/thioredoxin